MKSNCSATLQIFLMIWTREKSSQILLKSTQLIFSLIYFFIYVDLHGIIRTDGTWFANIAFIFLCLNVFVWLSLWVKELFSYLEVPESCLRKFAIYCILKILQGCVKLHLFSHQVLAFSFFRRVFMQFWCSPGRLDKIAVGYCQKRRLPYLCQYCIFDVPKMCAFNNLWFIDTKLLPHLQWI